MAQDISCLKPFSAFLLFAMGHREGIALLVVLPFFVTLVDAVLPPGYEDELYCPAGYCRRPKEIPKGWVGPAREAQECVSRDGATAIKPTAWGPMVEKAEELKTKLKKDMFHMGVCPEARVDEL